MSQSLNLNEAIISRDGGIFINNFAQNDGYDVREQALQCHVVKAYPERRATSSMMKMADLVAMRVRPLPERVKGVTQNDHFGYVSNEDVSMSSITSDHDASTENEQVRYVSSTTINHNHL